MEESDSKHPVRHAPALDEGEDNDDVHQTVEEAPSLASGDSSSSSSPSSEDENEDEDGKTPAKLRASSNKATIGDQGVDSDEDYDDNQQQNGDDQENDGKLSAT
jgi:hypothetical protein